MTVVGVGGQWALASVADPAGILASRVTTSDAGGLLAILALATFGAIVIMRGDSPRYGWLMLTTGAVAALVGMAGSYSLYSFESDVPLARLAIWTQDLWMVWRALLLLLLPALFPDGKVASPGWRIPVKAATAAWIALIVVFLMADRAATNVFLGEDIAARLGGAIPSNPTGFIPVPMIVTDIWWALLELASVVIGIGSLITRWRGADVEMRQRLKWVIYALAMVLAIVALQLLNLPFQQVGAELGLAGALDLLMNLAGVALAVCLGLAVLKYRLYDVNLVINRTIVYGVLTVIVVVTYVAVVVGVGAMLPIQESLLALAVTGAVAVAFAPLRQWVQGWVNRLMYGHRDDPYSVLAKMGRLLAGAGIPEDRLHEVVRTIAVSLNLPGAGIELEEDGEWRELATHGKLVDPDEGLTVIPLRHQGDVVGRLLVAPRSAREPLSSQDIDLLEDLAHQAGALARSVRLTAALQRSRERLLLAREEERRRIRHDLHDELGPSLAGQTFQLDAILDRVEDDPVRARELLTALKERNQQLVADIRRLVYELRPPALDDLGVAGALAVQIAQIDGSGSMAISLNTTPDPLPDLPAAVELAAYRIAREAITNTIRHAEARECTATLEATGTQLIVTVDDDGIGIDETRPHGVGLTSMRERTEELGGTFQLLSPESGGTVVRATLPVVNGSHGTDM